MAKQIHLALTPDTEARLGASAPVEAEVYEAYLRGAVDHPLAVGIGKRVGDLAEDLDAFLDRQVGG